MAERTEERTRDRESETDTSWTDVDVEGLLADETDGNGSRDFPDSSAGRDTESSENGFRARLRDRRRGLFSPRVFVGVLVLALAVGVLGGIFPLPLIGGFAGLLGVFAAAFAVGLVSSRRHYLESGLAGVGAAGVMLLATSLDIVFLAALRDFAPEIGVVGAGAGLLAGIVGHYFGRDLRRGLTADL